jgi:regulator of sigma E protease
MQPYEFRAKKAWQKLIVLSAGVIMNVILAIAIFTGITYSVGNVVLKTTIIGEVEKKTIASKIGFKENDKVISINNTQVKTWNDILLNLTSKEFGNDLSIKVNRNNKDTVLNIKNKAFLKLVTDKKELGLMPGGIHTAALTVNPKSPAEKSGIQPGDTILTLNNVSITTLSSLQNTVKANKGKEIEITYKRKNSVIHSKVRPNESGLIGIGLTYGPIEKEKFGFFQSLAKGTQTSYETIQLIFKSFRQIIKGTVKAKDSLGGPIMIADQANQMASRGLMDFLSFMAMLSISLAILNILPIPALDGGHILILLIEKIIRRELGEKTKILIQQIGLGLILLLMVFTFYNDIARFF